ncbi:MAG: large ribosomal subunit protein bL28 [Minisyncoccia bacterium]
MAKICPICGKKPKTSWKIKKLRGKFNPTTKVRKIPNLQWVFVPEDVKNKKFKPFAGKRILTCAKCIKTLTKRN